MHQDQHQPGRRVCATPRASLSSTPRLNLAADRLPPFAAGRLARAGIPRPSANMFHGLLARAVEVAFCLDEARRLLAAYERPAEPAVGVTARAGVGCGASEAPRGLLWHRYELDAGGGVRAACIVPPTSQNQAHIEEDLRASLAAYGLEHDDAELTRHCEKVIRNYDPCISCATHFLRLTTERR